MAFNSYGSKGSDTSDAPQVDFNELNKYVVETADLTSPEILIGYVSMIVDLGIQEMPDQEFVFAGDAEEENEILEENEGKGWYFKDGYDYDTKREARFLCKPQKPKQNVAVAVDFPDIIVDKGQFFGESNPLPLRLWLGGQFYDGNSMVIGRPTALKENTKLGGWGFDKKHLFYRMGVGAKLIEDGEPFPASRIDELLGRSFQFEAQVFFKKNKGKEYYTEKVRFVSGLGRGQSEAELLTTPHLVQFFGDNEDEAVKEVRAHVLNTAKKAENWEESDLKEQVERVRSSQGSNSDDGEEEEYNEPSPTPEEEEAPKTTRKPRKKAKKADDDEEDDSPF